MEYELNVNERLLLLNIMPQKGNIVNLRVIKDIVKDVGFSEEEIKEFEIKSTNDGKVMWNSQKAKTKKINLGDTGRGLILNEFKKLNDKNEIPMEYLSFYEKINKEV